MPGNVLDINYRLAIIKDIKSEENRQRKSESFSQSEIYNDRQHQYVVNYLRTQFSEDTVKNMPIVSSINLAKRIVKQEASIYKTKPKREFFDMSDKQKETVNKIYEDGNFDAKLLKSNENYKLQNQNIIQILPQKGKIMMRTFKMHQIDVIPDETNPEYPWGYIISSYDKSFDLNAPTGNKLSNPTGFQSNQNTPLYSDNLNQIVGDRDDYKATLERYVVWTKEHNFLMDGKGKILSEDTASPIPGILPFVDVCSDKDYEFYNRQGQTSTDFSVQFNAAMSDLWNVVRMQGWAQAYLIAHDDVIPQNLQIGPNFILKLPVNKATEGAQRPEFGFANTNADIEGSMSFVEALLSTYLSSRGIDPKVISGSGDSVKYNSGIERFLAMFDKFEASQSDISMYTWVEKQIFEIVKSWHNALKGTEVLLPEYQTDTISDKAYLSVQFFKPELVKTEAEKLDVIERRD